MKVKLIIFLILLSSGIKAQRFSTGFNMGTTAFLQTRLKDNYILPSTSYIIYYTGNDKKDGRPVFDQYINGILMNLSFNLDYKRWMITSEIGFSYNKIKTPINFHSTLGNDGDWGYIKTFRVSMNYPIMLSYKLSNRANGYFVQGGFQYSMNTYDEMSSPDSKIPTAIFLFMSQTELLGTIYTEQWNFWSAIFAVGYKKNDQYSSLRLTRRVFGNPEDYPTARFWQVDIVLSRTLNFQKLKKGHIIYED